MNTKLFRRSLLLIVLSLAPFSLTAPVAFAQESEFARPLARPWLGIILGASDGTGVEVELVLRTSPADQAELRQGDRVIAVDGEPVRTAGKLLALVRGKRINSTVDITVRRGEEVLTRSLQLPASPTPDEVARRHLVGAAAPAHELQPADGAPLPAESLDGKPYLLDFWATWCQACKLAEPRIAAIAERYDERLTILTISDEEPAVVRDYLQGNDARHSPVYLDTDRALTEAFLVRALPTYALVGADGRVLEVAFGVDEIDRIEEALSRALPSSDAPTASPEAAESRKTDSPDTATEERPNTDPGDTSP
ncbi:PDZ domain-containing protein [Lujinxingia vulgaris]|uniref:PDZ domain-containing protein n=1 Tax=Lujinxingia vulgaris TaxID=2600176 RepID=A0A5C6XF74_9DELT|nr:PDZ domain-containing protein [Lujinxingia vulgaris]TXD37547.1 PDZ domain-containing protein [Lujinxingia vulgaris]